MLGSADGHTDAYREAYLVALWQPERRRRRERQSDRDESETVKGDGQRPGRYTESWTKAGTNER